ncbi:MAG TPA: hypothetical protein VIO16_03425 [Dehalococcoidia bacterium]|jgi:hypothetical protein
MSNDGHLCRGAMRHTPTPAEHDMHHLYPKFMCALLGIPERRETVLLCSGCHDLIHHVYRHLVNEGHVGGHHLSGDLRGLVESFWTWWQAAAA